jgi:hypothetical protein
MNDGALINTLIQFPEEPDWHPLVAVARLAEVTDALPSIDVHDFMYMAAVVSRRGALRIHLYKHRETRHYLNLDDGGHAYEYCGPVAANEANDSGGRYRLHRSIAAALLAVLA